MARPSIKEKRTEEILQAYEICIARYGVAGATLHRVAEEAGLARALLRHNVGNSEDLLQAAAQRFVVRSKSSTNEWLKDLPKGDSRIEKMLESLFFRKQKSNNDVLIAEALIAAAQARPELQTLMEGWFQDFEAIIQRELVTAFPTSSQEDIEIVATGVIGIYYNFASLFSLQMSNLQSQSHQAAFRLVQTLA